MANDNRIGELLLREKLITPLQLQQAMQQNREEGGRLTYHLTKMGFLDETQVRRDVVNDEDAYLGC